MDELRARFNARIRLHVRDGWEVVRVDDHQPDQLEALLATTTIGRPRATGRGVARQAGTGRRYCRRITVGRDGTVRVSNVACPPDLTTPSDLSDDRNASME